MTTRITPEALIDVLLAHPNKGVKNVAMQTRTFPKLTVKSRLDGTPCPWPQGGVAKLAFKQVKIGASYENAVQKQRDADGNDDVFVPGKLWNGLGVYHTRYTVQHSETGVVYFAYKPATRSTDTEVGSEAVNVADEWQDVATGRKLDVGTDRLNEYLPKQYKSKSQDVEHDVQWRVVELGNVLEFRFGGHVYTLA